MFNCYNMKKESLLFRMAVLLTAMMYALGVSAQEAYAWFSPATNSLTFCYDNARSVCVGTTYDLNDGAIEPGWVTDGNNAYVKHVAFDHSFADVRPTSTYHWFYEMRNLESIVGMRFLNTSEVTRMDAMFSRCYKLTVLELGSFNTAKVTDMSDMFRSCSALQSIYARESWTMTDMALTSSHNIFKDCNSLVGGKGTAYDANHVDGAYARIDGGTDNPGYFTGPEAYVCYTDDNTTLTFYYDHYRSSRPGETYELNEGSDAPGWAFYYETTRVVFDPWFADARPTTTFRWFCHMLHLKTIEGIEYLNTSEVTNMGSMFFDCNELESVDFSHFNTEKVERMDQMCTYCYGFKHIDLSSFDTHNVKSMNWMFADCQNLRTIYAIEGLNTDALTESYEMFRNCYHLVGGQGTTFNNDHLYADYAHVDGGPDNPGYFTDKNAPEAYAVYTEENTTLTFYCDYQRYSRTGKTYSLKADGTNPEWNLDGTSANVTNVVFDPSFANARPRSTKNWFYGMYNLESIEGMESLNTSEVTDMSYMFGNCQKLTSIDVSHFNTSKVTKMSDMFAACWELTSLDLSSFNTANVTEMDWMFYGRNNLQTIYVGEGWSTAAVTNSEDMFNKCHSLVGGQGTTYDENHLDAAYAHVDGGLDNPGYFTDKYAPVAYACYTPENTTLTFYYDNQRLNREGMTYFMNTGETTRPGWRNDGTNENVTRVVFDPSFASARPTTTYQWFYFMENLQSITGLNYLNTSEVTNMAMMFSLCSKMSSIDVSHFDTGKVTNMAGMFVGCESLTSLNLCSFNTSNVTDTRKMFSSCYNLTTIFVDSDWSVDGVTLSDEMFFGCNSIVGGKGTTYDGNHVDKAYARIDGGSSNPGYLTGPQAYVVYTAENTTMTFYYDIYRSSRTGTTYDLNQGNHDPSWNTDGTRENVTKVIFDPSFARALPTSTYAWFSNMENLQSITGMGNLNTSEVTTMRFMFTHCHSLASVDMSHFNTAKVTNMYAMFYYCRSLTSLDLSSFDTHNVTDMDNMFYNCDKLHTIYGTDWDTGAVTASRVMFYRCYSLVGGMGTPYSHSCTDHNFARIDGGHIRLGYFTEKPAFTRGDVNGDGSVNISDVTALIDLLLGGGTISNPAADCNQDGSVNISDVTALIDYLLSNHW